MPVAINGILVMLKVPCVGERWYAPDPNFTRWTQQDPIAGSLGNPTSQCRYAYANDDPVNLTDPGGNFSRLSCGTSIIARLLDLTAAAVVFATGAFNPILYFLAAGFAITSLVSGLTANSGGMALLSTGLLAGSLNLAALGDLGQLISFGALPFDVLGSALACGA